MGSITSARRTIATPALLGIVFGLALLAYLPVLGIGFLSDDYGFLFRAETRDLRGYWGWNIFLPSHGAGVAYYRPFGMIMTWQLGWQLWGLNPLPYHLLGLLLHAATSVVLALLVADLAGKQWAGIFAGSLFAVFPAHTEAVGWLSAQWDIWAALFSLLSLWLFTRWWKETRSEQHGTQNAAPLYLLSLLAYTLAIFSKESALTWIMVIALVPLLLKGQIKPSRVRAIIVALLPFAAVLLAYTAIRFAAIGSFGVYDAADNSIEAYQSNITGNLGALLAPINSTVLANPIRLSVGVLCLIALAVGLAVYSKHYRRLVIFLGAALGLTILPVTTLRVIGVDLQGNRLLYLPSTIYCAMVGVLLYRAIERTGGTVKRALAIAAGVVLVLSIGAAWMHLSAWQTATRLADGSGETLARLIPYTAGGQGEPTPMRWFIQDPPDSYKGAQIMRNGLDDLYHFITGAPPPMITYVTNPDQIPPLNAEQESYKIRFLFDEARAEYQAEVESLQER